MRPHIVLAAGRNIVHTAVAIRTVWSLFGSAPEGQAALYLFQKLLHFRVRS